MHYTYLLINIFTVIFPLALSFDKKVRFYQYWKFVFLGTGISGLVFLFWDVLFTARGVWWFNDKYIIGIKFLGLPLEEILFFLTVPFACTFIYCCLNYYLKRELNRPATRIISNIIIILSLVLLAVFPHELYTRVAFGFLAFILILLQFIWKVNWLNRFYAAYAVSLVPFYVINGLLTALPVVIYNNSENMGFRIGTIPFEDHFYCMALLLMNIGFFEYFKSRNVLIKND